MLEKGATGDQGFWWTTVTSVWFNYEHGGGCQDAPVVKTPIIMEFYKCFKKYERLYTQIGNA